MTNFIAAIILLLLAIAAVVARKVYFYVPPYELKRQAEQQDPQAVRLYRAVAYGNSLRAFLWIFIGLTSAGSLILLARIAPVWLSLPAVTLLLWAAFSWLPASNVSRFGARFTVMITPAIAWLLNYLHPVLGRSGDAVQKHYSSASHTGLFERDDLLALIARQQQQPGSRLTSEELETVEHALKFGDHKVHDVLTPRQTIKTVLTDDTIGPVLIDELHQSGQDYVLVRDKPDGPFVGTLAFKQLSLQATGHVRDVMDNSVYYVHENDTLHDVLRTFSITNHPAFVVINSFEEYVGIITVTTVLQKLVRQLPDDDFDQYSDISAVAGRHPKRETPKESDETPVETATEMVE